MPVRVLGADGTGQDADIISGLVYAVDHGANVVLMAFSNPGESAALQAAVDYAWSNGVVVVAAAGNDGGTTATYPAGLSKVVGVGATRQGDAVCVVEQPERRGVHRRAGHRHRRVGRELASPR